MNPKLLLSLFLAFSGFGVASLSAQSKGDPEYLNKTPLNVELSQLGDFKLTDAQGTPFLLGRMIVDFASIYTVAAEHPDARGECPFMVAEVKDGQQGKTNLHKMRYFISLGKSYAYLYSNVPKSEIALEFEFEPGKEFAEGAIRVANASEVRLVGAFKMRIKEVEKKR